MNSQREEQKPTECQSDPTQPRFRIEKLEERIAPAKGGITGPPDGAGYIGHCKGHQYGRSC